MHPRVGDEGRPGFAVDGWAPQPDGLLAVQLNKDVVVIVEMRSDNIARRPEAKVCDRRPGTPAHPRELLNSCPEPWLPGGRDAAPRGRPVSNSPRGCAIASGNQRRFPHLAGIETNCRKTRRHASQRRPASFGIIVGERRDVLGILKFLDLDTAQQRISKVGQRPSFGKMFQASYFRRMFLLVNSERPEDGRWLRRFGTTGRRP
mmetsp:Transcript_1648/g.7207  ORF Transcript_1648/g.7207 Transcript_1648/m.7207 type:complete len:204 (+) Transcript_1648:62-673(+)